MHIRLTERAKLVTLLMTLTVGSPAACAAAGLVCPVTKLPVASPKAAVGKSAFRGKTYYFCTSNCKRLFDKNPAKYVKQTK